MAAFSPQHYLRVGRQLEVSDSVLQAALARAALIGVHPDRAIILTLRHLSALSGVPYLQLRKWVGRRGREPYHQFFLAKGRDRRKTAKPARRSMRRIAVPHPSLMLLQRWILQRILHTAAHHHASVAFHRGASIIEAARLHCRCRWLIKLDVRDFFESIYEPNVFDVFVSLGYSRLVAFELTRICTRKVPDERGGDPRRLNTRPQGRGPAAYESQPHVLRSEDWASESVNESGDMFAPAGALDPSILPPPGELIGSLPQGAPTSPLLANLAMHGLDDAIEAIARAHDLTYTRYADDIALSTRRKDFNRADAALVIGEVIRALEVAGLRPQHAKTRVVPPGARKIVLGLAVDGTAPRLTREYRNKLRLHAHMLGTKRIAAADHARALQFRSVLGMRRHIEGCIAHAERVEPEFAATIRAAIADVNWAL